MTSNAKARVAAIIQGRMGSSRLPGKILRDIAGQPMLAWVVERVRMAKTVDEVVVATTSDASDDPAVDYCVQQGYPVYRGSLYDVLDRFYQAAQLYSADIVVRITADCPLIDPAVIDRTVFALIENDADFSANRLPPPWKRTYPIGLDTEVCTFEALERAWHEATAPHEREHVLPYLYEEPGRFKIQVVDAEQDFGHLRWTVDTPEDLRVVRRLVELLDGRRDFSWLDVLAVWQSHPELEKINAEIVHHKFDDIDERYQN
jgi:spore coat polysaccharide biosynthesis protein SpsF